MRNVDEVLKDLSYDDLLLLEHVLRERVERGPGSFLFLAYFQALIFVQGEMVRRSTLGDRGVGSSPVIGELPNAH